MFRVRVSAIAAVESTQIVEADTPEEARQKVDVESIDDWRYSGSESDIEVEVEKEIDEPDMSDAYKLDDLRSLRFSLETARQNVQIARSQVEHYTEVGFCPPEVRAEARTSMDDLSDMETRLGRAKIMCGERIRQIEENENG